MNFKTLAAVLAGSLLVSFALYGNTIKGEFVYDDQFFHKRQELRDPRHLPKLWTEGYLPLNKKAAAYRPVTISSFALNFILFGKSPASFHVVNIILNGLVVFVVFLVVSQLFGNQKLALITAAIYAFLPIHTQTVASIKSRDEILASLFSLVAWLVFLKATQKRERVHTWFVVISSIIFYIGVLSKEMIIVLPALFLLVFWIKQRASVKEVVKTGLLYLPASILYFGLRFSAIGKNAFDADIVDFVTDPLRFSDFWTKVFTPFKIAFIYISKTFVPINLSANYQYNQVTLVSNPFQSWEALVGMVLLGTLIGLIIYKKTRTTPLGIGALTFLISYTLISKFFFKVSEIMAEHWMYLPSLGLSLVLGFGIERLWSRWRAVGINYLAVIIAVYTIVVIARNRVWLSNDTLVASMLRSAPGSAQTYIAAADTYLAKGDFQKTKAAAETAYKIYGDDPQLLGILSHIAFKEKRFDDAEAQALRAIELNPTFDPAYLHLARVHYETGRYELALAVYEQGYKFYGARGQLNLEVVVPYCLTLTKLARYQESIAALDRYARVAGSRHPIVKFIYAVNYYKLGDKEKLAKYFDWDPGLSESERLKLLEDF